jgi:hypothetical protein
VVQTVNKKHHLVHFGLTGSPRPFKTVIRWTCVASSQVRT